MHRSAVRLTGDPPRIKFLALRGRRIDTRAVRLIGDPPQIKFLTLRGRRIDTRAQSRAPAKVSSEDSSDAADGSITIEDIYNRNISRCPSVCFDGDSLECSLRHFINVSSNLDPYIDGEKEQEKSSSEDSSDADADGSITIEDIVMRKLKEAEQLAVLPSEKLEESNFLLGRGLSVHALNQTIRSLTEEKVQMDCILRDQVAEMLRELAVTNVSLQIVVSELNKKETDNKSQQEIICLLDRLRGHGKEGGFSTFKLDQELCSRVSCLENQALGLLREISQLGGKLLEYEKGNVKQTSGMGGQFLIECNVKIQGFKRGIENLSSSLQTVSSVINEKSCPVNSDFHQQNAQKLDELKQSDLKVKILQTITLREKLCSKERDIEQLHAELAAAVRENGILKCEEQNALDAISCANHKMKDFELQMMKEKEHMNQQLHECMKELSLVKSTLPKESQERDKLWEDLKQYSEKNSENSSLKQKVEVLEEDVLLKEGQITILKDSIGKRKLKPKPCWKL